MRLVLFLLSEFESWMLTLLIVFPGASSCLEEFVACLSLLSKK